MYICVWLSFVHLETTHVIAVVPGTERASLRSSRHWSCLITVALLSMFPLNIKMATESEIWDKLKVKWAASRHKGKPKIGLGFNANQGGQIRKTRNHHGDNAGLRQRQKIDPCLHTCPKNIDSRQVYLLHTCPSRSNNFRDISKRQGRSNWNVRTFMQIRYASVPNHIFSSSLQVIPICEKIQHITMDLSCHVQLPVKHR